MLSSLMKQCLVMCFIIKGFYKHVCMGCRNVLSKLIIFSIVSLRGNCSKSTIKFSIRKSFFSSKSPERNGSNLEIEMQRSSILKPLFVGSGIVWKVSMFRMVVGVRMGIFF